MNLVGNAVKYTPEGGAITVARRRARTASAVLRVRDDGIGMAPELAARVFDLFVQGDRALDRASGGLGIGLTLVRRLARAARRPRRSARAPGPGSGSEITVRFPAIPAPPRRPHASRAAPRTAGGVRDVLVVEDNEDARAALCELLELGGTPRARRSRRRRRRSRLRSRSLPEIALIDVGLPGIDGYEVARRMRAGGRAAHITLVALTGYGLPEDRERALAAGFDLHLVKPVNPAVLTELMTR